MIKTNTIKFSYTVFETVEELTAKDRELVLMARKIAINAYAPYSKFKVGAAIRLTSDAIICGTNVENAAFPSGLCAERNALSNSLSNHPGDNPVAIAIAAMAEDGLTKNPVPPCGNCRQVIAEEESRTGNPIKVILAGKDKTIIIDSIGSLLPLQFNKENLNLPLQ